jgi:hypothetical protein
MGTSTQKLPAIIPSLGEVQRVSNPYQTTRIIYLHMKACYGTLRTTPGFETGGIQYVTFF